ncbi:MAG: asparagine synthase (glutamine-hydrolyzing) [Lachnospiraceae bacterium]|nr:asparagine synthase (glutamine-hydrolyzing) [Lachnospiraceae bacterium]
MCGIAGYYNPKDNYSENPKNNFVILTNMINSMKMRGPDDSGYSIIKSCCLAHSRLSIIDLDMGRQPFKITHKCGNFHIVFNGEIYNHLDIKKELLSLGFQFYTKSDTEVIGNAFIHWGPAFVEKLNGIFAIAIYDESNNAIYLFRDRFGIKPLYYKQIENTLIFASRIDTLFEYPNIKPTIDLNSLNEIFTIGPAKTYGKGVFCGIKEILPGEYLVYTPDYFTKHQYYKIKSVPHTDSYKDTVEKVRYLIEDSVRMQMISDVPICTFLSGGIDSSLVSSICSKYMSNKEDLTTYSFDFEDNDIFFTSNSFQPSQDKPYVDIMKDYLGSKHIYLSCKYKQLADLLEESVDSRCLPTMADVDSSLLFFCKEVSKNHKVALTGECADEIFGGYPWFHREDMLHSGTFPWMMDISFRKSLLNPEFAASLQMEKYIAQAYNNTISEIELIPEESKIEKNRRQISYLNIKWFMQTLLDRMDRTSMHSGLEARVPFADHRIVDYVFNIPWEIKAKNNIPKNLLREASYYYLPDKILNRPKCPYPKTYHPEYEEILVRKMLEVINDTSSPIRSYLNLPVLNNFLMKTKEYGKPWYGQLMAGPQMIAYLLQINYWLKKYSLTI